MAFHKAGVQQVIALVFALSACSTLPEPATRHLPAESLRPLTRGQIVPLADHHQHIFGELLVDPPTELLPEVTLPRPLAALLRERERISGSSELGGLYAADAKVLNIFFDTDHWVTGETAIGRVVQQHGSGIRFIPFDYHSSGGSAHISGIVHADREGEYDKHFQLSLKRDSAGRWRIASEAITDKKDNPFRHPLDAATLIRRLDDAGIQRAAVLSTAFWLANPRRKPVENEREKVRQANDWVIEQTAPFGARLVPFCAVNPLSAYAMEELERCAGIPRTAGMKLHFANNMIDLKNAEHLAKVKQFFRAANRRGMALVVHLWPRGDQGPEYSRIFIDQVLGEAPDVPVQIAHLGSGSPAVFHEVLAVFARAIAAGDPRTRNLYFDVTEIISEDLSQGDVDAVTRNIRQIGLARILFGSDTPLPQYRPPPLQAWATFRRRMPLSDEELLVIANNVAPYMQPRSTVK